MYADSVSIGSESPSPDFALLPARSSEPAPSELPALLERGEGPFRDFDLLSIGTVLIGVLAIHAMRKFLRRR